MPAQSYTPRGFGIYAEFNDTYGATVSAHQSSAAEHEAIWVEATGGGTVRHVSGEATSAHLNVEQARTLRDALTEWLRDVGAEER